MWNERIASVGRENKSYNQTHNILQTATETAQRHALPGVGARPNQIQNDGRTELKLVRRASQNLSNLPCTQIHDSSGENG